MRSVLALALVFLAGFPMAAGAASDTPPPGAIPGWFDPTTGRFEPLQGAAEAETPPTPAARAVEEFANGVYTMKLFYSPKTLAKPDDTLECTGSVSVGWLPVDPKAVWINAVNRYTFTFNSAWKARPPSYEVKILVPTRKTAKLPPFVQLNMRCVVSGVDTGGDSVDYTAATLLGDHTYGPNVDKTVHIEFF